MGKIPTTITLWICPACGKITFSRIEFGKTKHYAMGETCPGEPQAVIYVAPD